MLIFIMRRPSALFLIIATSAALFSACTVSVGDGVGDGDGGASGDGDGDATTSSTSGGGEGGESSGTTSGDAGGKTSSGDGDSGTGGSSDVFQPTAFVAPEGLPTTLPQVSRTGGYSADSPQLRIRDAFRVVYGELNEKLTDECGWGSNGYDFYLDLEHYRALCSAGCMNEFLSCEDDAETYVCEGVDSTNTSDALSACLSGCETFACDDGSADDALRCDAEIDCDDASDEKGCGDISFVCGDETQAVSGFRVCDGSEDCDDGSDEEGCGQDGFVCDNGKRIDAAYQCDGAEDCVDGEDEVDCGDLLFNCGDGFVVSWFKRCNRELDCPGGEDEDAGCVDLDPEMTCTYGY